jgi:hypothetical protein
MPEMKNSFLQIKSTFVDTAFGKISLQLSTDRAKVMAVSTQGIQVTLPVATVDASNDRWVSACRDADPDKFNSFISKLEGI